MILMLGVMGRDVEFPVSGVWSLRERVSCVKEAINFGKAPQNGHCCISGRYQ